MKNIKHKKIAEVAGVSPASVSRFFDKNSNVCDKTKKKISETMVSLQISMPLAKVVGLIIPDGDHPYFTSLAFEFEKEFEKCGWHLLISNSGGLLNKELQLIEHFLSLGASGLIYMNGGKLDDEIYSKLIAKHHSFPVLTFDRYLESRTFDYIVIDSRNGTLQAVDYLYLKGHRRIAYLKGLEKTWSSEQRYDAYREAMLANKVGVEDNFVFSGDFKFTSGVACAERILHMDADKRPTAIICANDLMAIGLMQRLQEGGMKLPEQLSVIGFDDIPVSKWVYPPLTTIEQPIRQLVSSAVSMLLKRIKSIGKKAVIDQQTDVISPRLVVRGSVAEPFDSKGNLSVLK